MTATALYQIILEKVPDDRQSAAAIFLSGCFSLPPASTRGIAGSGPIAILSDMPKGQAEAVLAELSATLPSGVELRVAEENETASISRLQWPRPPRIYGRDLGDFDHRPESHELDCPICGGKIRVYRDKDGGWKAVPGSTPEKPEKKSDSTRRLPDDSDKDPLFSGIKPLASAHSNLASLRSLQAGDTGFWMDYGNSGQSPSPPPEPREKEFRSGEASNSARKTVGRGGAGLAAFMKPGVFALVVGRTKDSQTVKMVAEIMGLSETEARERCMNLGTCVARDISLDEAQNLLARFKNLGVRARIVKPRG